VRQQGRNIVEKNPRLGKILDGANVIANFHNLVPLFRCGGDASDEG
jgi:hypothetical protein